VLRSLLHDFPAADAKKTIKDEDSYFSENESDHENSVSLHKNKLKRLHEIHAQLNLKTAITKYILQKLTNIQKDLDNVKTALTSIDKSLKEDPLNPVALNKLFELCQKGLLSLEKKAKSKQEMLSAIFDQYLSSNPKRSLMAKTIFYVYFE
jgi:hypothetical protein